MSTKFSIFLTSYTSELWRRYDFFLEGGGGAEFLIVTSGVDIVYFRGAGGSKI